MSTTTSDPGSGVRPGMEEAVFEVGPMRPDPAAVSDLSRRVRIRREGAGENRYPFPIPNGWFVVDESRELAPGEHKNLYAFGKDLVLFRSESGEARLMDAYCPHMGAHIGVGGKVDGEGMRCPFHGWHYDGDGRCIDIPYAKGKAIPAKARVRTYPIIERDQMIWAWHHLEGHEPFYDVPYFPEFEDPDWQSYEVLHFEVATIVQEFSEGEFDVQHFKYVHGAPPLPSTEMVVEGTYRHNSNGSFTIENFGPRLHPHLDRRLRADRPVPPPDRRGECEDDVVVHHAPLVGGRSPEDPRRRLRRRHQPGHRHLGEQALPAQAAPDRRRAKRPASVENGRSSSTPDSNRRAAGAITKPRGGRTVVRGRLQLVARG